MRCSVRRRSSHETHALRTAPRLPSDLTQLAMLVMDGTVNLERFPQATCMCNPRDARVKDS
jgi:hypothetical protein